MNARHAAKWMVLAVATTVWAQEAPFGVTGLGDCEKLTKDEAIPASEHFWDAAGKRLTLHGAKNETVAAQLVLTAKDAGQDVKGLDVTVGDLVGPKGKIASDENVQLFLELYQFVQNGSASWGPPSKVLPSKKWYPDALAPFRDPYDKGHKPVAAPFDLVVKDGPNQAVWIDVYVPRDAAAGKYEAPIKVTQAGKEAWSGTLELTVHDFVLSDEFHVDAFGEMYGMLYKMHGVDPKKDLDGWWKVAKLYHQMAQQHRFAIMEREECAAIWPNKEKYAETFGQVLDGKLFTKEQGYRGPGEGVGPSFWRAPFGQWYNGKVPAFTQAQLDKYTATAKEFWALVKEKGWDKKRFVAYITDEWKVDAEAVANERKLQQALDAGTGGPNLSLVWPSHVNAASLVKDPAVDLTDLIRWWAPNGHAADTNYFAKEVAKGKTVWFYHSGHPCIGVNVVNATGVELRTWSTICWRYGINGSWWWAMDHGDVSKPFAKPVYKDGEDRWGNGVIFYPGCRLKDVGLPNIDGPVASMRMKAYRRGNQDYEYGWLLRQAGKGKAGDEMIRKVIPTALTEASGETVTAEQATRSVESDTGAKTTGPKSPAKGPPWATDVGAWYQMRKDLAAAIEKK